MLANDRDQAISNLRLIYHYYYVYAYIKRKAERAREPMHGSAIYGRHKMGPQAYIQIRTRRNQGELDNNALHRVSPGSTRLCGCTIFSVIKRFSVSQSHRSLYIL